VAAQFLCRHAAVSLRSKKLDEIDQGRDFLHQNRVTSPLYAPKRIAIAGFLSGYKLLLSQAVDFARLALGMA
jgi:hypothetical protein